ncbi:hypothetical protein SMNM65_10460 [Streptococcus mitis]|uniref:Uncharacterized protein n=1 Tax=Streptococcus mitis TaxID=28037 RepID=A0A7G1IT72_STRMT|nr:hypothetical protein SMNM65_10460 [Streptococcus mitis]
MGLKKIIQFSLSLALVFLGYLFGFLSIWVNSKLDYNSTLIMIFSSLFLLFSNTDANKLFLNYKNIEIVDEVEINKYVSRLKYLYLYFTSYPLIISTIKEIHCLYTNLNLRMIQTHPIYFVLSIFLPYILAFALIDIFKKINYLIMSEEHKIRMFIKTILLGSRIELNQILVKENYISILRVVERELKKKLNIDLIHLAPVSNQDIGIYSNNKNSYILTVQIKYIDTSEEEPLTIESILLKIQIDFKNNRINHVKFLD